MKRLAVVALVVTAATGCSSASTPSPAGATRAASASTTTAFASTPSTGSATTSDTTTPTVTATKEAESLGRGIGAKIAFYAIARAAGMNDSAKMDELAEGICSRIASGKPDTVGPWMKDAYDLKGDMAAEVAIAAITSDCPTYKSLVGS